jgi:hypothetical protein
MTIRFRLYERRDPRLGRNLRHDSRSLAYPYLSTGQPLRTVQHERHVPVFDQGQLGSCTGNAALGALGTGPYWDALHVQDDSNGRPLPGFDEAEAVAIYSEATRLDNFTGTYPPDDTGSDGLSVAKVLKSHGWVAGYRHVLTGESALADALQTTPVIVGVPWYQSMFEPDPNGFVGITPGSALAGGHEFVIDGYDVSGWFNATNSWGESWGQSGRFKLSTATVARLLKEDGDATVFVPAGAPAPAPITNAPLARLLAKESHWLTSSIPAFGAISAQRELKRYLKDSGLS